MKSTSRYDTNNATPMQEAAQRKHLLGAFKEFKNPDGTEIYAIVYGFIGKNGKKKLLKYCPMIANSERFEMYVRKHKQIVLAVYNRQSL